MNHDLPGAPRTPGGSSGKGTYYEDYRKVICDDDAFISWGNVYSVFRLLEKDGEYALAEFYKSD